MNAKSSSWKQKIDPVFDKFIKSFLSLLEAWGLPVSEGYINIAESEPYFRKLKKEGFPSFVSFYEINNLDNILEFATKYCAAPESYEEMSKIFNKIDRKECGANIGKSIEILTARMDEVSKNYYRKWDMIPDPNRDLQMYLKFVSDIISLQYHLIFVDKGNEDNKIPKLNVKEIQWIIFTAWSAISFSLYKKSLWELYQEAKNGNDDSLFKLIKLDKTSVDHDWIRIRIRKAAYSGNRDFFDLLAKAIRDDPLKHRKIRLERHLVLMNFWFYGLYRLTIPELMQLLEDSGISIPEDEVTFRKFTDREIKPFYGGLNAN